MKSINKYIIIFILSSFFGISISYSQDYLDPQGIIRAKILNLIQARYGLEYKNVGYSIFDTLLSYAKREHDNKIQDPFGTLKGCILFSTYKDFGDSIPSNFIAGIIKNNRIIWDNAPGTNADLGGDLLYAKDINNDGKVDLLISEDDREYLLMSGKPPFLSYLYILTWDGKKGSFINDFRVDGKSYLQGDGGFELVDKNKKGIYKITTTLPDIGIDWEDFKTKTFPRITYSWNGKQYGLWPRKKSTSKDQTKVINNY